MHTCLSVFLVNLLGVLADGLKICEMMKLAYLLQAQDLFWP